MLLEKTIKRGDSEVAGVGTLTWQIFGYIQSEPLAVLVTQDQVDCLTKATPANAQVEFHPRNRFASNPIPIPIAKLIIVPIRMYSDSFRESALLVSPKRSIDLAAIRKPIAS